MSPTAGNSVSKSGALWTGSAVVAAASARSPRLDEHAPFPPASARHTPVVSPHVTDLARMMPPRLELSAQSAVAQGPGSFQRTRDRGTDKTDEADWWEQDPWGRLSVYTAANCTRPLPPEAPALVQPRAHAPRAGRAAGAGRPLLRARRRGARAHRGGGGPRHRRRHRASRA